MHEPSNDVQDRVERLTTEVASLKLELATLVSALRETRAPHAPNNAVVPRHVKKAAASGRPSPASVAIVVLFATSLLAWQLITSPRLDLANQKATQPAASRIAESQPPTPQPPRSETPTDPPITPLVKPTIYKGTLAIAADRPGARVFVNRQEVGVAPVRIRNLKAGAHLVWIESEGFRRWTRVVTVPAERVTRVSADLEPVEPAIEH